MTDDRQTHRTTDDRQIVNKQVHPFQMGAIKFPWVSS